MLKGEFVVVAMNAREWNGKTYYNLKIKIGNFIYDANTNADTYLKLREFERFTGTFSLFGRRTGGLDLRLDGVE